MSLSGATSSHEPGTAMFLFGAAVFCAIFGAAQGCFTLSDNHPYHIH
jgi:hypothetical protein